MAGKGASMENDQPRDDDRNEEVEESPAPDPEEGEPVLDDGPAEDLVLADLEDRKVAPGTILIGLREPKRELADPPLDRLQSQRHPSHSRGFGAPWPGNANMTPKQEGSFHGQERARRDDIEPVHHRLRTDRRLRGPDAEGGERRARADRRRPAT